MSVATYPRGNRTGTGYRKPARSLRGARRLPAAGPGVHALNASDCLIVSCEHGGNRIPQPYAALFASRPAARALGSHRGFDIGAAGIARMLARKLQAPLLIATVSRLLIDLNRSLGHANLFSAYSRDLDAAAQQRLIAVYYLPHRRAVGAAVRTRIATTGLSLHVAVHSFTPVLGGKKRGADIGFLYDPARDTERRIVRAWIDALGHLEPSFKLRRNYPYRGTADGLTTALRRELDPHRYAGIEIEINQALLANPAARRRLGRALSTTLAMLPVALQQPAR